MKRFFALVIVSAIVFFNFGFWYSEEYENYLKWYNAYTYDNDYETAIYYFEKAYDLCDDEISCAMDKKVLILAYNERWTINFMKENIEKARELFKKSLKLQSNNFTALVNLGTTYMIPNPDLALEYFYKAKDAATTREEIEMVNWKLDAMESIKKIWKEMEEEKIAKENSPVNDPYAYQQYYLQWLNIYEAQKKITWYWNYATIAIIDDWIYINHPDLADNIWYNRSDTTFEIDWNWKDDDGNWYIDDYNGWNFVTNSKDMTPTWEHWTMVAWIIWARTNNGKWIAWIIPSWHVKLMPLIVFDSNWYTTKERIIKAMEYAIDNWANVINLSLWWNQFEYSTDYDEVFKKAMKKNVMVVVAAGNWDVLSNWINTRNSELSPVCNWSIFDWNNIWVGALTKWWKPASWSNYWNCIDTWTYWEDILTTTIDNNNPYTKWDWTSFAAPMISAIIWLWYVQYWKLVPDIFRTALHNTFDTYNGQYVPDASAFLDNVWKIALELKWELQNAIDRMYNNWLTKFNTPDTFMYSRWLRRDEAAKFFVQYAKQLWKTPDYSKKCNFKDLNQAWDDLRDIVVESCQLWLFQWSNSKFMPAQNLTNAQAVTVFMRLKEWFKDENWRHFALYYWSSAASKWYLKWTEMDYETNFDNETTRWNVALMMYRWRN